jgi:hypothetical protein
VSDDNAYAESLFRAAKYRPEFPAKGFADLDQSSRTPPPPHFVDHRTDDVHAGLWWRANECFDHFFPQYVLPVVRTVERAVNVRPLGRAAE